MFKNLKLLLIYIRILKMNRELLRLEHGISIDWVWRMYKTYVIPIDEMDHVKEYGFKYVNQLVQKDMIKIDNTFIKIGLSEYVGLMEAIDLSDREIGLAFRFKYLDTTKIFNRFVWMSLYLVSSLLGLYFFSYIGIAFGLLAIFVIYLITRILV